MARIGIHTEVSDQNDPRRSHAWITIEGEDGIRYFSLYPKGSPYLDDYPEQKENGWDGSETNVREHIDEQRQPTTSLYQELTPEQEQYFWDSIEEPQEWNPANNCSHWAAQIWEKTTEQKLETNHELDYMSSTINSPIGLEKHIRQMELSPYQEIKIPEREQENTQEQSQDKAEEGEVDPLNEVTKEVQKLEKEKKKEPLNWREANEKAIEEGLIRNKDENENER